MCVMILIPFPHSGQVLLESKTTGFEATEESAIQCMIEVKQVAVSLWSDVNLTAKLTDGWGLKGCG